MSKALQQILSNSKKINSQFDNQSSIAQYLRRNFPTYYIVMKICQMN